VLSNDVQVDDCVASGNGTHGIQAGTGSTIRRCLATGNIATGITGSGLDGLNILECNTENNGSGIATLGQTIVKDSFSRSNRVSGIAVGPASLVAGCNSSDNGTNGVFVDLGSTVQGCIVENNRGHGIVARNGTTILNCSARINGFDNIQVNGITIASDDVTIDLNDHALVGVAQALDGIQVMGARINITIRNGSVLNWPGDGVDAGAAVNSQLRNLSSARNGGVGLRVGEGSLVSACTARSNNLDGIIVSSGCRVVDCTTSRNGSEGIVTGSGCVIEGSTAFENEANGISAGLSCAVVHCIAYSNGTNGIFMPNTGFLVPTNPASGRIVGCVARSNTGNGIQVGSRCFVENNNCAGNVFAQILVTGSACRIDSNHATGGQRGFHISGTDNLIIRNSTQGASVLAYDIAAGNHDAARISSPGANFGSTAPWANFSF
jgi:hypothetical protein